VRLIRSAYERFASLVHELLKFGTVGLIAFVIDVGGSNLLYLGVGLGPQTSKVIAFTLATSFAYTGNRLWTFRHREQSGLAREYFIFFLLNGICLLISLLVIGFVTYTLKLTDALSYNIAQLSSIALGTMFRLWSYKKWVFLAAPAAMANTTDRGDATTGTGDEESQAGPLTTR
jgi:putative flippase GtrA